jgi:hypothetical protein
MDMMAGNGAVEVLEVPNNTVGLSEFLFLCLYF